jgi:hypothetical protein
MVKNLDVWVRIGLCGDRIVRNIPENTNKKTLLFTGNRNVASRVFSAFSGFPLFVKSTFPNFQFVFNGRASY